jgi:hypothetical protein
MGQATHWTGQAMAQASGISLRPVQRIWGAQRLQPHRRRSFKRFNDPAFAEKVEDIVGLYMDPPMLTVVVSIDKKSRIQPRYRLLASTRYYAAAVDATAQVIVAHDLINNAAAHDALAPLLDAVTANTEATPSKVSADSGYCSEANWADLNRRGIRGYVATGRAKHPDDGEEQRRGPLVSAMRQRLRRAGRRSRYRLRKQVVEPVFGQIKGARGFQQFLLRGIEKGNTNGRCSAPTTTLSSSPGQQQPDRQWALALDAGRFVRRCVTRKCGYRDGLLVLNFPPLLEDVVAAVVVELERQRRGIWPKEV